MNEPWSFLNDPPEISLWKYLKKCIRCWLSGHTYLLNEFDEKGAVVAFKCFYCGKTKAK